MHTIENFELVSGSSKALLTFHAVDAPSWLGQSVFNRRGLTVNGVITFECMGPHGAFTLGFGPVPKELEASLTNYTHLTFAALTEAGPAYVLEFLVP